MVGLHTKLSILRSHCSLGGLHTRGQEFELLNGPRRRLGRSLPVSEKVVSTAQEFAGEGRIYLFSSVQDNTGFLLILKILDDFFTQMNWDTQLLTCIIEHDLMKFAPMTIEDRYLRVHVRRQLMRHDLSCIVLVDLESIFAEIDTDCPHFGGYRAI